MNASRSVRSRSSATRRTSWPCVEQLVHADERAGDVFGGDRVEDREPQVERRAAERGLHRGRVERAAADGERLVEQRQGVAGRPAARRATRSSTSASASTPSRPRMSTRWPVSCSADSSVNSKCWVRDRMVGSTFCGSVVASTNTTCAGGSSSVFSSVFDAAGREHVDLVDDVHLAPRGRAEAEVHALDEVAHRVDAVVRRRVELDEVVEGAVGDRDAVLALAARLAVGAEVEAVQRLGEDARGGRLAGAARAGEEVGVADAVLGDRVAQRGGDVVLADQLARSVAGGTSGTGWPRPDLTDDWRPSCDVRVRVQWRPARSTARQPGGTQEFPLRAASFRT